MNALVLVADGSEEIEVITVVDILRRAHVIVTIAAVDDAVNVTCSRGVNLVADAILGDLVSPCKSFEAIILPGGLTGAETFSHSTTVQKLLREFEEAGKLVCAMCASTIALFSAHVGKGKRATSYPSFKERLAQFYEYQEDTVVVDDGLITSRGPATAMEWALAIVQALTNVETRETVAKQLLFHRQ